MIHHRTVQLPHGINLECHVAGEQGRPMLLFLHGFPEAAFVWDDLLRHFAQPDHGGYYCVAPNLRGYAGSSAPTEVSAYRAQHLTQDIAALVAHVTANSPTPGQVDALVAHDWGGALAWGLAAQHPALLQRLVILNAPHAGTFWRDLQHDPAQQAASAYMNFLVRPDAEALLSADDFARLWPFFTSMGDGGSCPWLTDAVRAQYRAVWRQGLSGPLNYYRASPLRPPSADRADAPALQLPEKLLHVSVPTLVLWGLRDHALLPHLLEGLEQHVPHLRIERLADASHWLLHEQPDRVRNLLTEFLQS